MGLVEKEKMIRARRLFLLPSLSMFLLLIPFGWLGTACILYYWYMTNQKDIHLYFRGVNYRHNETSKEELEKLK